MDQIQGGKRRSFYGWGYEEDVVGSDELQWFEKTWSGLFKVDRFEPAPMPVESEITLRPSRVTIPTALRGFCTDDPHVGPFGARHREDDSSPRLLESAGCGGPSSQ